jgi:hypothetical protein
MECPICTNIFTIDKINDHVTICIETIDTSVDAIDLTPTQKKAIEYCKKKSRALSSQTYYNVLIKGVALGHSESKVKKLLNNFSKRVELAINFHFAHLDHFIRDGLYKNLFETGTSSGCTITATRMVWENSLFNKIYSQDCAPSERVKYGSLHLFNTKYAPKISMAYGECAMILKDKVKDRTSFVVGDSSMMQFQIGTIEYSNVVLNLMNDSLFDNLIKYYNDEPYNPDVAVEYIEIQIHGLLRMMHDVEAMYIPSKYDTPDNKIKFEELFEKFGIVCYFY